MKNRFPYHFLQSTARYWLAAFLLTIAFSVPAQDVYMDTGEDSVEITDQYETLEDEESPSQYKAADYAKETYVLRKVPDSVVRSAKRDEDFAYASDAAYWTKKKKEKERKRENEETGNDHSSSSRWERVNDVFDNRGLRWLFYGLIIAFFVFVIYRIIVVNQLFMFYSPKRKKAQAMADVDDADINDNDLDVKIQQAIATKNHRAAVRYLYLKTLRLLNEKGWIRFHAQATNFEYIQQMSEYKIAEEFRFLTQVYEYVWYGEFAITEEQFDLVHNNFRHFFEAIKT